MDPIGMIRHRAEVCQSLFSRCLSHPRFSELDWFENRQGEFNLWAASLKVISSGRPSLDYRLRDRPEVHELICDLLDGLSEALLGLLQPVASELTTENDGENTDEMNSIFSAFSSDGEDAVSLPSIGKADGVFSEQMFNIKSILGQLARISTAIRRSGANYRYQKADALLDEESFKDFKRELTVIVLMGSMEARIEEPADNFDITAQITDSSRLTVIQNRLIHANIVRRNRIKFATRSMQSPEEAKPQQPQLKLLSLPDIPAELPPQTLSKDVSDKPVTSSQAPSIVANSDVQTATDIGSQFRWEHVTDSKTQSPSVMTKFTRTGTAQDYPACPKPVLDDLLRCPYCADILPTSYSKQVSRWKGHVAQDVLPHICIHADCQTPNKMYHTSDELLKHMLSQHGVVRWVCDHCATNSAADETFVFSSFEDWERHMRREHTSVSTTSQLLSLSKVSQRRMLEPQKCPLCGYAAEHSSSTLDDHITKHLHEFALRCLPWGTGGDDADSVIAKSVDPSYSSDADDEDSVIDGEDSLYLDATEFDSPDRLCDLLIRASNRVNFLPLGSYVERLQNKVVLLLLRHMSFLEAQAKSTAEMLQLDRDKSYPMPLASLGSDPPSTSQYSQNSNRPAGNLRYYPDPSGSHASLSSPAQRLSEAAISHMLKITRILYQIDQEWGFKAFVGLETHGTSHFETYRNMMLRSSFARAFPSGDSGEASMNTQIELRWNGLTNVQKDEFVVRMARETDQKAAYLKSNTGETQKILEDELTALSDVISKVADLSPLEILPATKAHEHETPYFITPAGFRPNFLFVGRKAELKQLHRFLFDQKRRAKGTSAVLIHSRPGGGKSHLAKQYVFDHKNDFPGGIFWLRAKSEGELSAGFWDIASVTALIDTSIWDHDAETAVSDFIIQTRNWLSCRQDWLLVLDGIHFREAMRKFLPNGKNTSIIFTSTERTVVGDHHYLNPQVISLPLLSVREARRLLLLELNKKEPFDKDDLRYSMELVLSMGLLPVVIHSVAQRLKVTDEPLSTFAKNYSSESRLGYFGACKKLVGSLKELGAWEALNLMYLLCFFGPNVPIEMIRLGLKELDINVRTTDPVSGKTLNNTLKILSSFTLIDRSGRDRFDDNASVISGDSDENLVPDVNTIELDNVVQEFFIDSLRTEGSLPLWLSRTIRLFCTSFDTAEGKVSRKTNAGRLENYRLYEIHGETLERQLTEIWTISKDVDLRRLQDKNRSLLNATLVNIRIRIRRCMLDTTNSIEGGRNAPVSPGYDSNNTYDFRIIHNNFSNSIQPSSGNTMSFGPNSTNYGSPQIPSSYTNPGGHGQARKDFRYPSSPPQYYREGSNQEYNDQEAGSSLINNQIRRSSSRKREDSDSKYPKSSIISIEMYSQTRGDQPWHGVKVTVDTATKLNWISSERVEHLGLEIRGGYTQSCVTFSGQTLASDKVVTALWSLPGGPKSYPNEFWVAENPPFDVLFGNNFLSEHSHLLDEPSPALVLASGKIEKSEKEKIEKKRENVEQDATQLGKSQNQGESSDSRKASTSGRRKASGSGSHKKRK